MSKFDEFHTLRKELAGEYEKELQAIHHLLDKGVHVIGGHQDFLSIVDSGNFVSKGRARTLFKAAVTKGLESILQQYLLDLTREAVQLGLHANIQSNSQAAPTQASQPEADLQLSDTEPSMLSMVADLTAEHELAAIDPALIRNIVEATRKKTHVEDLEQPHHANGNGSTAEPDIDVSWASARR